jgi:hypothetical protein
MGRKVGIIARSYNYSIIWYLWIPGLIFTLFLMGLVYWRYLWMESNNRALPCWASHRWKSVVQGTWWRFNLSNVSRQIAGYIQRSHMDGRDKIARIEWLEIWGDLTLILILILILILFRFDLIWFWSCSWICTSFNDMTCDYKWYAVITLSRFDFSSADILRQSCRIASTHLLLYSYSSCFISSILHHRACFINSVFLQNYQLIYLSSWLF